MPENKPERIAAVVVTYNRKQLLGECVDSLLRQTHPLDALYIIDNCSTDGTCEFLTEKGLISPPGWASSRILEIGPVQAAQAGGIVKAEGLGDGEWANHRQAALDDATQSSRTWGEAPECGGNQPVETVCRRIRNSQSAIRNCDTSAIEVHYVRLPENAGGAGGFAEGMQRAAGAGFDWLWLMDDDLLALPDALAALVQKKASLEASRHGPFVLNSLVLARGQPDSDMLAFPLREISAGGYPKMGHFHWRLSEVLDKVSDGLYEWICPFNGTFVPARAVEAVGLPNREMFIHGEEKEYQCRLAGTFRLYTVVDSRVFHPQPKKCQFDWKQYYNIRNMFVVNSYFNLTALRDFKLIVVSLAWGARHGTWGMKLMLRAIRDGLAGRLGKRDDLP